MKKVNLLSKAEMKKVLGGLLDLGDGGDTGSCGVNVYDSSGNRVDCYRGISKSQAQADAAFLNRENEGSGENAKWCCDSCTAC